MYTNPSPSLENIPKDKWNQFVDTECGFSFEYPYDLKIGGDSRPFACFKENSFSTLYLEHQTATKDKPAFKYLAINIFSEPDIYDKIRKEDLIGNSFIYDGKTYVIRGQDIVFSGYDAYLRTIEDDERYREIWIHREEPYDFVYAIIVYRYDLPQVREVLNSFKQNTTN